MSGFEFIFALYGLLLGLSVVEVLGGFARTVEARLRPGATVRVGALTPLLGAFVLLDLISFWYAAWVIRDLLAVTPATLLGGLLFASGYYLAAHLVFPREPADAVDLDAHYFAVHRIVSLALLALLMVQLAFYASVPQLAAVLRTPRALALAVVLIALLVAAAVVRTRRVSAALLGALIVRYLVTYAL